MPPKRGHVDFKLDSGERLSLRLAVKERFNIGNSDWRDYRLVGVAVLLFLVAEIWFLR